MTPPHVLVADWLLPDFDLEQQRFQEAGVTWSLPDWKPPSPPPEKQREQLLRRIATAPRIDGVLFQLAPLDAGVINQLPDTCRLLQRVGTGLDTVDLEAAAARGVTVRNTPDYCVEEVAVHTMAMLLSLHRQLDATQQRLRAGEWSDRTPRPIWRLSTLTLGVVGLGRIGRRLADRMRPLVRRILFHDPAVVDASDWAQSVSIEGLLREADFVALHCPLNDETRHLIDSDALRLMKPTAILINAARGGLIDAQALALALDEGRLGGAGLDVYEPEILPPDSPLRSCQNTILSSHTGWYSEQSIPDARKAAVQNVLEAIFGATFTGSGGSASSTDSTH